MSIENKKNNYNIDSNKIIDPLSWLYDLKIKKISNFSEKDMQNINNIMLGWYKEWVNNIDLIKDKILSTWWFDMENEVMIMLIVSIISYYLNNNFYDKVNLFLKNLKLVKLDLLVNIVQNLISKYKNTDKYYFIKNHCQWILFYTGMFQKNNLIEDWWLEAINIDVKLKLNNVITELDDLKQRMWEPYWFNYFNTLVSYTNYGLVFLDTNDELVKKYIKVLLDFVLSIDVDLSLFSNTVKTVYVNNLSILYKLSWNILIKQKIEEINNIYLSEEKNWLRTFSKFYWWLDIDKADNNVSYVWLILENDKVSKLALSFILSKYSPVLTIKNMTWLFYSYYKNKYWKELSNVKEEIYQKINSLHDLVFHDLMSRLKNMTWFNYELIDYFIKVFLIQYLWLNVNETNLSYKINLDHNFNDKINLKWFNEDNDINYQSNIVLDFKYNWKSIQLSISLNWNINKKDIRNKVKLYSTKFEIFFKEILDKLLSLDHFLNVIDKKISLIEKKHIETVQHMERVGILLHNIYDEIQNNEIKWKIDLIKQTLSISDKTFFKILWYLHDIWKFNNLDIMWNYEFINMRIDSYKYFLQILIFFIGKYDIKDILKDSEVINKKEKNILKDSEVINKKEKINLNFRDVILKVEQEKLIFIEIDNLFKEIKSFNIWILLWNNLFINDVLNIAINISNIIKEKWYNIKIVNEKYKNKILLNINRKFWDSINYQGDLDDLFLWIIILFEIFSKKLLKEITYPHIEYWLQFFWFLPEFSYLSPVLYHHSNYPSKDIIDKYHWFDWLRKFSSLMW